MLRSGSLSQKENKHQDLLLIMRIRGVLNIISYGINCSVFIFLMMKSLKKKSNYIKKR